MRSALFLLALLLLPVAAFAQAAITGVVKDTSGGVLPGVTVEAASPVLIEKVRSVVSDGTGQYRIVDLRPGTYSVTFTLTGFSTVKREGIELTGTFVATVNAELKVGAVAETITVKVESPTVDVQSAKVQQTMSKDTLAALPTSRNASGIQNLIPGMITSQLGASVNGGDSGGIQGGQGAIAGRIHGGKSDGSRTKYDGLNTDLTGGATSGGQLLNVGGAQEIVLTLSGGLGEAEGGGVTLNVVPRDGANTFSGMFAGNFANGSMQGNNYTQSLIDQGLKTPSQLLSLWDVNPMGGGRIIRDRLWFFTQYRENRSENTVPGMWFNKNAGNPAAWTVDFDKSRQAFNDTLDRTASMRITWQVTTRNKLNLYWNEMYNTIGAKGGGTATQTIEATGLSIFKPSRIQQVTWSSPLTSRVMLEAGFGDFAARWTGSAGGGVRIDGTNPDDPRMIRVTEQGGQIPGLIYKNGPSQGTMGFGHNWLGTNEWRASVTYVSGAHNMKFGYQGGFSVPSMELSNFGPINAIRMNNGVVNQLTEVANYPGGFKQVRHVQPINFYAQDQWTTGNLTLQGGVRWDNGIISYPTESIGGSGYLLMPTAITYPGGSTQGISWHDVTPRAGVAYDLFGNGKTALKFNLGKYMEGFSSLGGGAVGNLDPNPMVRLTLLTTRSWTDTNKDFVANCDLLNPAQNGECGAMNDQNFGKVFSRSYDPTYITGWGHRPYNWSLGASVQQEVLPRVSVNGGYFRNWWGNWYVVDNRATSLADYTPFSIAAPLDSRLPNGGGYTVSGLYNLVPDKVGQVNEFATAASNYGQQIENWQGVDFGVSAQLRDGLTVQGGTSTGRRLADACAVRAVLPELGAGVTGASNSSIAGNTAGNGLGTQSVTNPYCRTVEPYRTSITGLATYTIPKVDLQVSAALISNPGPELAANYVVSNAVIAAGPHPLGRPLSGGAANVTVNLIAPGTLYGTRRSTLDFRVAKIVRYRRTRTQFGIDVYNLTNTDVVLTYNNNYVPGGAWLTPTSIQPARYVKVSAQIDF
jgi:hypothetical protein